MTQRLTVDHVVAVAPSGRGKSAHAHHHGRTTQGDPLAPHVGHGKPSRAACRPRLTLLAVLCPTVGEGSDDQDALLRRVLARRQTFFNALQACRRSMVVDHEEHVMDGMIRGLELASQFDTS